VGKYFAPAGELFKCWEMWATDMEEYPGSSKNLSEALQNRGFQRGKSAHVRGYFGLRLNPKQQSFEHTEY